MESLLDKKCDNCGKKFATFQNLLEHRVYKHGAKYEFKCEDCDFIAKWPKELKEHRDSKHPKNL